MFFKYIHYNQKQKQKQQKCQIQFSYAKRLVSGKYWFTYKIIKSCIGQVNTYCEKSRQENTIVSLVLGKYVSSVLGSYLSTCQK